MHTPDTSKQSVWLFQSTITFSFFLLINSLTYGGQYATVCLHNTLTSTVTNGHCTNIINEFAIIVPTTDNKTTEVIVYTTS